MSVHCDGDASVDGASLRESAAAGAEAVATVAPEAATNMSRFLLTGTFIGSSSYIGTWLDASVDTSRPATFRYLRQPDMPAAVVEDDAPPAPVPYVVVELPPLEAGAPPRAIALPRSSEWRGFFNVNIWSKDKKRGETKSYADKFSLRLEGGADGGADAPPSSVSELSACGIGGCSVGEYKLTGSLRLADNGVDLELAVVRAYTGRPKVRSPPRPKPRPPPPDTRVGGGSISGTGVGEETVRASGRVRIKSRFYAGDEFEADDDEDAAGADADGASKRRRAAEGEEGAGTAVHGKSHKKRNVGSAPRAAVPAWETPLDFPGRTAAWCDTQQSFWAAHLLDPNDARLFAAPASLSADPSAPAADALPDVLRAAGSDEGRRAGSRVCIYEGEMVGGLPHGRGTLVYPTGLMFEGSFVQGREVGWGVLSDADDEPIFAGEILDGLPHGMCTYFFSNGDVYAGGWRHGLMHGRGSLSLASGGGYEGGWVDGARSGTGTQEYADGSIFTGGWRAGQRHGRGELIAASGLRYRGAWVVDVMEGKGVVDFPGDGGHYEGSLRAGQREGRGTYTFAAGQQVSGRWADDVLAPEPVAGGSGTPDRASLESGVLVPRPFLMAGDHGEVVVIPINLHSNLAMGDIYLRAGFTEEGE